MFTLWWKHQLEIVRADLTCKSVIFNFLFLTCVLTFLQFKTVLWRMCLNSIHLSAAVTELMIKNIRIMLFNPYAMAYQLSLWRKWNFHFRFLKVGFPQPKSQCLVSHYWNSEYRFSCELRLLHSIYNAETGGNKFLYKIVVLNGFIHF